MIYNDEQRKNIEKYYGTIENYERINSIQEAQNFLNNTDYIVIKAYEYQLQGQEISKDISDIFNKRESARNIIRKYEDKKG